MEFAETCIASDAFVARSRGLILDLATREINPTMVHRPLPTPASHTRIVQSTLKPSFPPQIHGPPAMFGESISTFETRYTGT